MDGSLPAPIAEFLARDSASSRRPAWLEVDAEGTLRASGGDLDAYGLVDLQPGALACESAPFLEGLLPAGSDPLHLPWIALEDERCADVYVLPDADAEGDWVLLLDATRRASCAFPVQQQRNTATLSRERSHLQGLLQNAREQKLAHEQLNRDLERKDVLAHCIVHDLKGPLASIQGYVQLARSGVATESQNLDFLDMALRQCRRQERLIRDLLDVFVSDSGAEAQFDTTRKIVLVDVVRSVVGDLRPAFAQADCILDLEVDRDVEGVCVPGGPSRMERVFANLLENALRHTPRDRGVRVAMHHAGAELVACVENEGEPIADDLRPRLFERFTQGREGRGSAGLGLFFCRITLERWGGSIAYRPRTGGGSCFEVRLPLAGT